MLKLSPPSSPATTPLNVSDDNTNDVTEEPFSFSPEVDFTSLSSLSDQPNQPTTLQVHEEDRSDPHMSKGHSRKHKSLALPAFSFNPAASQESSTSDVSPPTSPKSPGLHASPSKRGHRRMRSEFVGGDSRHQSPITSAIPPVEKLNEELARNDTVGPVPSQTPFKGHRHRRSGAVSSRDLTAGSRPGSASTPHDLPVVAADIAGPSSPGFRSRFPPPTFDPPKHSPNRVTFAENVEVIPRRSLPLLKDTSKDAATRPVHSSDGIESRSILSPSEYLSSVRPATVAASCVPSTFTTKDPFSASSRFADNPSLESIGSTGDFPSVSIVEHAGDNFSATTGDFDGMLNVNFDEDPTSAVELTEPSSVSQPASPKSPHTEVNKGSDGVIDLDSANDVEEASHLTADELRSLRAKSFSAARSSMHSGQMDASTVRLGLPSHRRTESAPSSVTPFDFDRPMLPRHDSQTASEKGFEMENVFEEDEEDLQVDQPAGEEHVHPTQLHEVEQTCVGLGVECGTSDTASYFSSFTDDYTNHLATPTNEADDEHDTPTPTNDSDIPSRSQTIRRPSSNRQSLVYADDDPTINCPGPAHDQPAKSIYLSVEPGPATSALDSDFRPVSQPLPQLVPPSWPTQAENNSFASTPQEPSTSSAWSTPKLDTAATSLNDAPPHLNLPGSHADGVTISSFSTEGVPSGIPSLISSRSTVSAAHRYEGSTNSPSTPSGTRAGDGSLCVTPQTKRRSARSSIGSIFQLLPNSKNGGSNLSIEQSDRCQTSGGLSTAGATPPSKDKRRKRLSRALKFWKHKDESPGE